MRAGSYKNSLQRIFGNLFSRRTRQSRIAFDSKVDYETLETRQVLAALFPTYINGEFTLGNGILSPAPYDLADTFNLSSNPDADKIIYLDFTGHHSVDNGWGHDIMFPAFDRDGDASSFSDAELIEIQKQFQNVAEDFLPFDVNVTTVEPEIERLRRTAPDDNQFGVRAVNTQATDGFGGFGGVAFLNSFNANRDVPVFTLNKGINNGAMTNSHEVGHALGLGHDGLGGLEYHPGAGTGETSWGPIMGAPFFVNVSQWSPGDYVDSTNLQDDLQVITRDRNGFDFRVDDYGNDRDDATEFVTNEFGEIFQWGIVERNDDLDFFSFATTGGDASISVLPFGENPNLDILATVYNEAGTVIATSNPVDTLDATFDLNLVEGTYYVSVEGTGVPGLYSDYGSLGFFTVEGIVENLVQIFSIGETGRIDSLTHEWQTIELQKEYVNPVVIAGPPSRVGGEQVTVRVNNVTSESFDIAIDEWDYLNGGHLAETVNYIVVEAGEYVLDDGTILLAGNLQDQTHRWDSFGFGDTFSTSTEAPIVLTQVMTYNDTAAVTTRLNSVTTTEFQIRLQEEQASGRTEHGSETVGFIAVEQGVGRIGRLDYDAGLTGDVVSHRDFVVDFATTFDDAPAFFAEMQSHNGGDVATVRYRDLDGAQATVFLEEETSYDSEVKHNGEKLGYWAIEFGTFNGVVIDSPIANRTQVADYDRLQKALETMESYGDEVYAYIGHDSKFHDMVHGNHDHENGHDDYSPCTDMGMESQGHDDGCTCDACTGMSSMRTVIGEMFSVETKFDSGDLDEISTPESEVATVEWTSIGSIDLGDVAEEDREFGFSETTDTLDSVFGSDELFG